MAEYIIDEDEYRAAMRKAYEAGAAGREVYTARDYLTRELVRCKDCALKGALECPMLAIDDDCYCCYGVRREEPCR